MLTEYTGLLWANGFPEHYGWNRHIVFLAIAQSLEPGKLQDCAIQIIPEIEPLEVEPTDKASDFEMTIARKLLSP